MTNAELYDIVKDHRDVWWQHFDPICCFGHPYLTRPGMLETAGNEQHIEMELIGLGVAWLAKNGGSANIYPPMSGSDEYFVSSDMSACAGRPSMLAAVYAAIAEVKRGSQTEV